MTELGQDFPMVAPATLFRYWHITMTTRYRQNGNSATLNG